MINSIQKGVSLVFIIWVAVIVFGDEDTTTNRYNQDTDFNNKSVTQRLLHPPSKLIDPWRNQYPLYNNYGERIIGTDY